MFPSPMLCRFGKRTARDSRMWPKVSEPASPHSGASGMAPIPAPSRTIRRILRKVFGLVIVEKSYGLALLLWRVVAVASAHLRLVFNALHFQANRTKLSIAHFVRRIVAK